MNTIITLPDHTQIEVIDHDDQQWLTAAEVGKALGYKNHRAVLNTYNRNEDEFTPTMTCVIKMMMQGQARDVRLFSLRGAHLLAMFAKTDKAKTFRRAVLDLIEKDHQQQIAPVEEALLSADARTELRKMIWSVACKLSKPNHERSKHCQRMYLGLHDMFDVESYKEIPMMGLGTAQIFVMNYAGNQEQKRLPPPPPPVAESLASLTGPEGLPEHHTETAYILRRHADGEGDIVDQIEHRLHDLTGWIGYMVGHCRETQSENEDLHKKLDGISRLLAPPEG